MRIRITVNETDDRTGDRTDDLRIAADVRRDVFAHSPVEVDPDSLLHGIHRDENGQAYFECSTEHTDEVRRVLDQYGHAERVQLSEEHEAAGEACQNCGNIAGAVLPAVCPNCNFRDISPCPVCNEGIPRLAYVRLESTRFRCPHCNSHVRLRFNEPLFLSDGCYNEPLVVVEAAEVRAT